MRAVKRSAPFVLAAALFLISTTARALQYDADVPPDIRATLDASLTLIGSVRGGPASPLHRKYFGPNVDGRDYLRFFNARVQAVGYDPRPSNVEGGIAYVDPNDPHRLWLTSLFPQVRHDLVPMLNILIHEARHTEPARQFYAHSVCPANGPDGRPITSGSAAVPLAGMYACDEMDDGAYALMAVLLLNVAKSCTSCTADDKIYAALYGMDNLHRLIDADALSAVSRDVGVRTAP